MTVIYAILALLGAHYVADFAMQNQYVADAKAKVHTAPDGIHALTAHAVHHAVAATLALWIVYLGTGAVFSARTGTPYEVAVVLGLIVGATHWFIDYGKAVRGWYGYHADQLMHLTIAVAVGVVAGVLS